jgi:hypothetical protein
MNQFSSIEDSKGLLKNFQSSTPTTEALKRKRKKMSKTIKDKVEFLSNKDGVNK